MRWCCWGVILFQFLWLNVVTPGHTRGAITLPGSPSAGAPQSQANPDSCCAAPAPATDKGDDGRPTPEQRRRCAVCYVAAGYTIPPVFQIDLAPAGCIAYSYRRAAAQVASHHIPLPYFPAGPPGAAAAHPRTIG